LGRLVRVVFGLVVGDISSSMAEAVPRKSEHKREHKTKQRRSVIIKILFRSYVVDMGCFFKYSRGIEK